MRCFITVLGLALLVPQAATAGTVHVDVSSPGCPGTGTVVDPFCSIQDAIVAALPGDVVLVHPGTYTEFIDFLGKAITVTSVGGPGTASLVAPAGPGGSVVTFANGEGRLSELTGFTIEGGKGTTVNVLPGFTEEAGGGIFCQGASPAITDNVIQLNFAHFGGGIYCDSASPRIEGNIIRANGGEEGLGIHCTNASNPRIADNVIADHLFGTCCGAGIYVEAGSAPVITGNNITGNSSSTGAGIYIINAVADVTDNTLANNFTDEDEGGGMAVILSTGNVSGNTFESNASQSMGGGLLSLVSTVTIEDNLFDGNQADEGGGIASMFMTADTIRGNSFYGNTADFGSAILVQANDTVVLGNDIHDGGGFSSALRIVGPVLVADNLLVDNPGGIDAQDGALLRRNTITGSSFGGIASLAGSITVESCVVWGNGSGVLELGGLATVSHSDVQGGFVGAGNLDTDPLFVDAVGGDYGLLPGSPCIDLGDPLDTICGTDLSGGARRVDGRLDGGSRVDMGALEFSHVRLAVTQPMTPLDPLNLTTTGTPLPTFVFAAFGTGLECVDSWGTFLVDLGGPWFLRFLGTGPLNVTTNQPVGFSGVTVFFQAVATDGGVTIGNTSNLASVTFP